MFSDKDSTWNASTSENDNLFSLIDKKCTDF